jgi:tRNA (guanine26-N2/guanine27-N2)-dimethyltransferase
MPSNPAFKSALVRLGYSVSLTHTEPTGIKTDAPAHVIWDIMKKWIEQQKAAGRMSSTRPLGSVAKRVLDRELYQDISFEVLESQKKDTIPRFLPNPEKDWGPKSRPRQPKRMRE